MNENAPSPQNGFSFLKMVLAAIIKQPGTGAYALHTVTGIQTKVPAV